MAATAESKLAYPDFPSELHAPTPEICILPNGVKALQTHDVAKVAGANVHYTITAPLTTTEQGHVLFVPGLGGTEVTSMPFAAEMVKNDYSVTTFDPPRHQKILGLFPPATTHPERLLSQSVYQIACDLAEKYGTESLWLYGHSMGGPAVVSAAEYIVKRHPKFLAGVAVMGSAGATGHTIVDLAPRAALVVTQELIPNWDLLCKNLEGYTNDAELVLKSIVYALHNPLRSIGETWAVTRADIRPGLERLDRLGIETAGIFFYKDLFFNCEQAEKYIGKIVSRFQVIMDPEIIGHLGPQLYPIETARSHAHNPRPSTPQPAVAAA